MQEKEYKMVVRWELKILSLGITIRHYEACPRDGIFNPHLTTIKDSYILAPVSDVEISDGCARKLKI